METQTEPKKGNIKVSKPKPDITPEGIYQGTVKEAVVDEKEKVTTFLFELKQQGEVVLISRDYPSVLEPDSPLLGAIAAIENREASIDDFGDEFDPSTLVGKDALVVVEHRSAAAGKQKAFLGLVLPKSYALPAITAKPATEPAKA